MPNTTLVRAIYNGVEKVMPKMDNEEGEDGDEF